MGVRVGLAGFTAAIQENTNVDDTSVPRVRLSKDEYIPM